MKTKELKNLNTEMYSFSCAIEDEDGEKITSFALMESQMQSVLEKPLMKLIMMLKKR